MQQSTDGALFACCPPVVAMPAGEVILPTPWPIIAFHWQSCLSETQPLSAVIIWAVLANIRIHTDKAKDILTATEIQYFLEHWLSVKRKKLTHLEILKHLELTSLLPCVPNSLPKSGLPGRLYIISWIAYRHLSEVLLSQKQTVMHHILTNGPATKEVIFWKETNCTSFTM